MAGGAAGVGRDEDQGVFGNRVAARFGLKPRDELRPHADRRGPLAERDSRTAVSGGGRAEDARHGANRRGDELPAERHRRESRWKKIREAKAALEAEARARAAAENAARAAEGQGPKHADLDPVRVHTVRPDPKAQRNFTDPDSRIMPASNKGWDQSGNAQALVDESQLIVAADVTQQANDVQQVAPLLDRMEANLQAAEIAQRPREFVADAGYDSDDNTQCVVSHGMVPYLATQRLKHHEEPPPVPRGRIPKSLTPKPRLARTLRTKKGRATDKKRKGQVEPPVFRRDNAAVRSNKPVASDNSRCADSAR